MKYEIPSNYNEMRNSTFYIVPSMLKKYQGLKPGAIPVGFKFKDEDVFKREDIVELHTKSKWLK
jgi:xeroderma pigmentosum group C-complementing protein